MNTPVNISSPALSITRMTGGRGKTEYCIWLNNRVLVSSVSAGHTAGFHRF
jgi:hypothetical protein